MTLVTFVFVAIFAAVLIASFGLSAGSSAKDKLTRQRLAGLSAKETVDTDVQFDALIQPDELSSLPWLDQLLRRIESVVSIRALVAQAGSRWTVQKLVLVSLACFAAVFTLVFWRTGAILPATAVASAAGYLPTAYLLRQRRVRFNDFEQKLPEALDMIVGALRAGHSLGTAIGIVAREAAPPVSVEFRQCYDEQNFGLDLKSALHNLIARVPIHDLQIVITAVLIQNESGGNLAEILEKVAYVTRERFRLKRQIRVHTAQGRLTGWILSLMPVVLGLGIYIVNPDYMNKLLQNEIGLRMVYTAAVMTLIGGLIIRKIVNVKV